MRAEMVLVPIFLLVGWVAAKPQATEELAAGCRYDNKIVDGIEFEERIDKVCEVQQVPDCYEDTKEVCQYSYRHVCTAAPFNIDTCGGCNICERLSRPRTETYQVTECTKVPLKECDYHWQTDADGGKVWVEDPSSCIDLTDEKCELVTKTRTVNEPYVQCTISPCDSCIPPIECKEVKTSVGCREEKYQNCCKTKPYETCVDTHKRIPVQVKKRERVVVCGEADAETIEA